MGDAEQQSTDNRQRPAEEADDLTQLIALATQKFAEAESMLAQATENLRVAKDAKTKTTALYGEAKQIVSQLRGQALACVTAKTQIDSLQAVVASRSDHIEQAQVHADKVRSNLDRQLTAATQQATEAEAQRARAESAANAVSDHLAEAKTAKTLTEAELTAAQGSAEEARNATQLVVSLSNKADAVEQKVALYESELEALLRSANERLATIDGLLPGATSAGLSSAFDMRRQAFLSPSAIWQKAFVAALIFLVFLALSGLWGVYTSATPLTYDELFRIWLARLPVAGALVWLALYASREAALAKRLEEDYGYKSAIAASFEGFYKQMSEIAGQATSESPLGQLCANTLKTIASPPGRIYDKHNLTVTPSAEAADVLKAFVGAGNRGAADAPK